MYSFLSRAEFQLTIMSNFHHYIKEISSVKWGFMPHWQSNCFCLWKAIFSVFCTSQPQNLPKISHEKRPHTLQSTSQTWYCIKSHLVYLKCYRIHRKRNQWWCSSFYWKTAFDHLSLFAASLKQEVRAVEGQAAVCCLYFTSIITVSLWLYRVSAAQDVVQQLILRLIHFLLNCPPNSNCNSTCPC